MKKIKYCTCALGLLLALSLSACTTPKTLSSTEYSIAAVNMSATTAAEDTTPLTLESVTLLTEVFGDGQKPSAAALEYSAAVDGDSLSINDYTVDGQTITNVYTNNDAAKSDNSAEGNYVILEFAYENSSSPDESMGGGGGTGGGAGGFGGPRDTETADTESAAAGDDSAAADDSLTIAVKQTGEISGMDGITLAAGSDAVTSSSTIHLVVKDFVQYEYTDPETGYTIPYNLYLPENYDESQTYPLMFFVGDSSVNSDVVTDPLTQGNGGTIWASAEEQAKHEAIVLVPQYTTELVNTIGMLTEDDHQWTEGLTLVSNLLFDVIETYSVDENRIYGTGQSQGTMANIAIADRYPELFAAQYLVAGQWDVEEMSVLKDSKLWITVSEGDTKAYPGMNEAVANWESLGTTVSTSEMWDSTSTAEEFDVLVADMAAQEAPINYTVFENGSHMYTWTVAFNIEGIRDWIFAQSR